MTLHISFPPQRAPRDHHVLHSSTTHLNSLPKHTKNPKTLKERPLPYPIEVRLSKLFIISVANHDQKRESG